MRETLKCLLHSGSWFILTRGFPSDQRKSPSMVLSFSPIHWYSLYLSQSEKKTTKWKEVRKMGASQKVQTDSSRSLWSVTTEIMETSHTLRQVCQIWISSPDKIPMSMCKLWHFVLCFFMRERSTQRVGVVSDQVLPERPRLGDETHVQGSEMQEC